jgi:hypothetical protein
MRGRKVRFGPAPLVVLARNVAEGNDRARQFAARGIAPVSVFTDDPTQLLAAERASFRWVIESPPTLAVWAAAVERGIPFKED